MQKAFIYEGDGWTTEGRKINTLENLNAIEAVLERIGPIIVEHWMYRGSRAPDRLVFDDYEEFMDYLNSKARPGDAIHIWSFGAVCKDDNSLADGKFPDEQGRVPNGGAY